MKNIVREVFSLSDMEVVKASYKNSVYYIVGSTDITEYVSIIKSSFDITELDAIKHGLNAFLKEHPNTKQLSVPKFNLVILDHPQTSHAHVVDVVGDIFRKDIDEAHWIAGEVHHNGSCIVLTSTYELVHTFACIIETSNVQLQEQIYTDIMPVYESTSMDSLEVIEQLIRRDFPGDI